MQTRLTWKLADYLEARQLSAYKLSKVADVNEGTIYRLSRKGYQPNRIDLPTLAGVIAGLRLLTGEEVGLEDILELSTESSDGDPLLGLPTLTVEDVQERGWPGHLQPFGGAPSDLDPIPEESEEALARMFRELREGGDAEGRLRRLVDE